MFRKFMVSNRKGHVEFISEGIFGKYSKRSNFDAFFRPSTLKTKSFFRKKLRVGYVYKEESFDTIFNMGYGGTYRTPPHALCVGKITHAFKG